MVGHIDFAPVKHCKNVLETYGMLCVKCNKCHRFNPDWSCHLCGKRTRAMKSRETWGAVETYDVLRLPICPDCRHYFTDEELGIARGVLEGYPKTLPFSKWNLRRMIEWREEFITTKEKHEDTSDCLPLSHEGIRRNYGQDS